MLHWNRLINSHCNGSLTQYTIAIVNHSHYSTSDIYVTYVECIGHHYVLQMLVIADNWIRRDEIHGDATTSGLARRKIVLKIFEIVILLWVAVLFVSTGKLTFIIIYVNWIVYCTNLRTLLRSNHWRTAHSRETHFAVAVRYIQLKVFGEKNEKLNNISIRTLGASLPWLRARARAQ